MSGIQKLQTIQIYRFVALWLALLVHASVAVADSNRRPLTFEMTVAQTDGEKGREPLFNFRIVNVSDLPLRVLDVVARPDLHDAYLETVIFSVRPRVELGRFIADPGFIDDDSFVQLAPGEMLEYALPLSQTVYGMLPPGDYQAYGGFRPDPLDEQGLGYYLSTPVEFTISE